MRPELAQQQYCYLTTRGRRTGNPHTIEIWFGLAGTTLYLMAGSRDKADWVRNLRNDPEVQVRLDGVTYPANARIVEEMNEDQAVRRMLLEKYQPSNNGDLTSWSQTALPVALDLRVEA